MFADKVLSALLYEQILNQDDIDSMKSWQHSGFNVFIGDSMQYDDQKRLLFSARYIKKCPLSNERLSIIEPTGHDANIQYDSLKDGNNNI